tara:strand:+ start:527 stop:844 length:318 start_codon:yes stop_codon:yes gene_type:complete
MKKKKISIFYTLCSSYEDAKNLALILLENNLAVCVNLIKNIESFYIEEKKIVSDFEIGIFIKTNVSSKKILNFLEKSHPYKIPFFTKLENKYTNEKYLKWAQKNN